MLPLNISKKLTMGQLQWENLDSMKAYPLPISLKLEEGVKVGTWSINVG